MKTVNSVDHAARLLVLLGERGELNITELSALLSIPRATIYRLVRTLILFGLVKQNGTSYRLGYRLLELASQVPELPKVESQVVPLLAELMTETGETSYFAVVDELNVTCLAKVDSPHPIGMFSRVGWRAPIHATAAGKAILAHSPPDLFEKVVAGGLRPMTNRTIVEPEQLRKELAFTRERSFAIDDGELVDGLYCIAVPLLTNGRCTSAICIAGPRGRMLSSETNPAILQSMGHRVAALF